MTPARSAAHGAVSEAVALAMADGRAPREPRRGRGRGHRHRRARRRNAGEAGGHGVLRLGDARRGAHAPPRTTSTATAPRCARSRLRSRSTASSRSRVHGRARLTTEPGWRGSRASEGAAGGRSLRQAQPASGWNSAKAPLIGGTESRRRNRHGGTAGRRETRRFREVPPSAPRFRPKDPFHRTIVLWNNAAIDGQTPSAARARSGWPAPRRTPATGTPHGIPPWTTRRPRRWLPRWRRSKSSSARARS